MSTETLGQRVAHTPLIALLGNPNCGKTALFNRLTGSNQKVANYAGVTIERKEGRLNLAGRQDLAVLDLPGTYSLHPTSPDERITCDVLQGLRAARSVPTSWCAWSMRPTCGAAAPGARDQAHGPADAWSPSTWRTWPPAAASVIDSRRAGERTGRAGGQHGGGAGRAAMRPARTARATRDLAADHQLMPRAAAGGRRTAR
jgi:hypothetical protein